MAAFIAGWQLTIGDSIADSEQFDDSARGGHRHVICSSQLHE